MAVPKRRIWVKERRRGCIESMWLDIRTSRHRPRSKKDKILMISVFRMNLWMRKILMTRRSTLL